MIRRAENYILHRFRPESSALIRKIRKKGVLAMVMIGLHIAGALTSVQAVMETRTPQGAVAWAVSLNTFPYVSLPAYWIFGRSRFNGYVKKRQDTLDKAGPFVREAVVNLRKKGFLAGSGDEVPSVAEILAKLPAVRGNEVELLRNGEEFFPSIFKGLKEAREYIIAQFYIVKDDETGRLFQRHLVDAARRGVRVYLLYDEIGSYGLSGSYLDVLLQAGVDVRAFQSARGWTNRFQLNFRNHRKLVVVDGRQAWLGGANIGDEYRNNHQRLRPWVDYMVRISGPAVQLLQIPFQEDWFWASGRMPDLDWNPKASASGRSQEVLVLPTGPADRFESCVLYFLHMINTARERIWICSPYFVPDEQVVSALQLAALRGVDVRVIVPGKSDQFLVKLSTWSFVPMLEKAGVKIFRYEKGFLHHKIMLVDSATSVIGTANFDNRSFRLNFEIMAEIRDESFSGDLEAMFLQDFSSSRRVFARDLEEKNFFFRLSVRIARLLAPVQ